VLTSAIAWLSVQGSDFRALFNGRTVLTALRLQLAHLGVEVVGRQLVSNRSHPAADDSIADLIRRLRHLSAQQP
jgi:hypothetical protein